MSAVQGYAQLQARLHAIGGAGSTSFMRLLGVAAVREQKLLVHRATGTTGRSIRLADVTPTSATTVVGFAGAFLEFGTRPHEITPKAAKALAWGGARRLSGALRSGSAPTHFAKRVHHPGTKPYPFMVPGAKAAIAKSGANALVDAWNRAA